MNRIVELFAAAYLAAEKRARPESIALAATYEQLSDAWRAGGSRYPEPREMQEARKRISDDAEAGVLLTLRLLAHDAEAFAAARSALREEARRASASSAR